MAAKILLAVVAAFCAFAALNATSVLHDASLNDEIAIQRLDLGLAKAMSGMQSRGFIGSSIAKILDEIEKMLSYIQQKIDDATDVVQSWLEGALERIEQAALDAAGKWNATLQDAVHQAEQAGIDIKECLNEQPTLADVVDNLKEDSIACIGDRVGEAREALGDLLLVVPALSEIRAEAREKLEECQAKDHFWQTGSCVLGVASVIKIKEAGLLAKAVYLASLATAKAAAVPPLASLCTAEASVRYAASATRVVDRTVGCIRGKFSSNPTPELPAPDAE